MSCGTISTAPSDMLVHDQVGAGSALRSEATRAVVGTSGAVGSVQCSETVSAYALIFAARAFAPATNGVIRAVSSAGFSWAAAERRVAPSIASRAQRLRAVKTPAVGSARAPPSRRGERCGGLAAAFTAFRCEASRMAAMTSGAGVSSGVLAG